MLKLQGLTIKNFLSIGNVTQSVNFNQQDLVLVLGENLDLGGNDNRNGVGKTSIVNGLSYALYGKPLVNVKMDNLINKSNSKNMLVTLAFEVNGVNYKIERGRKPGIFKFIKDGKDVDEGQTDGKDVNDAQGENKHTQAEIERIIGISHDMFKHILALNTYVEPFLAMRTGDQRSIIEQLLGITKLSEKAEKLAKESKDVKDSIKEEEFRISAATEANKRIESNIVLLKTKSKAWETSKENKIAKLQDAITEMLNVDIEAEIQAHKSKKEVEDLSAEVRLLTKELKSLESDVSAYTATATRLAGRISKSTEKICPTCQQEMDKDTHEQVHNEYLVQQAENKIKLDEKIAKRNEIKSLAESISSMIPAMPVTFYDTVGEAYNHKSALDTLGNSLAQELESVNPYTDQIESLQKDGLQEIDFTKMNELVKLRDHQDFLMKLLTNKDSFIRKKIIDQNLTFMNFRLAHYLTAIGLPHTVKFKSDLEVEIMLYGKEFDFDNLSRGERTRLILSLSWAFRDVFESMNDKINLMFIDELVDQGLDAAGSENVLKILKDMTRNTGKNIFLISHKDEYVSRIDQVLKVVKENGFTTLETSSTVDEAS
jgi:DNA repair exonuclease SbcCD ATPase subunit